jgi:hypothetical protein
MKPIHETMKGYKPRDFMRRCMTDFEFFAEKVLGLNIAPFHVEWANLFYTYKKSCILGFRGSGKTTITGIALPIWLLLFDRQLRVQRSHSSPVHIMIISNTMAQSTKILHEIKTYIADIELLNRALMPSGSQKAGTIWRGTEIQVKNGGKVMCKPYTEDVRGNHVDFLLMEEASLFRDLDIFTRACIPLVTAKSGHIMCIGTPMTEYDLLARCQLPNSGYKTHKHPLVTSSGESAWEWRFKTADIEKLKADLGELGFAREYMCEVLSEGSQAIDHKKLVSCLNPECRLDNDLDSSGKQIKDSDGSFRTPLRFNGTDLAMSAQGDYSVSITLEELEDGKGTYILRHMSRERGMSFSRHKEWLNRIYNTFLPSKMKIDKAQFGQSLIEELRNQYSIPCEPIKFTSENRKEIITKVIQMVEGGRLIIPRDPNDPYTMMMTDQLIKELSSLIPTKTPTGKETYNTLTSHDDCLMALAIACSMINISYQGHGFYMKSW